MEWSNIIVAIIAAFGGCIGTMISNNRRLAVIETKLDGIKEQQQQQATKLDSYAQLSERLTALEVQVSQLRQAK